MAKPGVIIPAILASLLLSALILASCIYCINPKLLFFWRRSSYSDYDSEKATPPPQRRTPRMVVRPVAIPNPPLPRDDEPDGVRVVNVDHPGEEDLPVQILEPSPDGGLIVESLPARGRTRGR